jgi:hypothetical protein
MPYFSSPELFSDLYSRKIYIRGTIHHDTKGMPADAEAEAKKPVYGERRHQCCSLEREKLKAYLLTNTHPLPASGHYVNDEGNEEMCYSHFVLHNTKATRVLLTWVKLWLTTTVLLEHLEMVGNSFN